MNSTKWLHNLDQSLARRRLLIAATAVAATALSGLSNASDVRPDPAYPSKPIRIIVPFPPGGGADIQGRIIAKEIGLLLGQNVIVENRSGANGGIGARIVASAEPDGYTLLVGSTGTHSTNEFLYSKEQPYNSVKDFAPISLISTFNNGFIVPASSPIKTLADLVAAAKKAPGELMYGVTVLGAASHLAVEMFKRDAGINVTAVPYTGSPPATMDLLGGRLNFMSDVLATQRANITSGKVRLIVTTDLKRSPVFPDTPTIAELGYPGFTAVGWLGLFAPAGTPPSIVEKLSRTLKKAYENPEIAQQLTSRGFDAVAMSPEEFTQFLANEREKWSKVIREAGLKLE